MLRDLCGPGREAIDDVKPVVLCEYAHAMGNSSGGVAKFWATAMQKLAQGYPLQGGFLWAWIDQSLCAVTPQGTAFGAFDGDFGDGHGDANFNCNGILTADRVPQASAWEVWAAHAQVAIPQVRKRVLIIVGSVGDNS